MKRLSRTKKLMKCMPYDELISEHKELVKHLPKDDPEYKEQSKELAQYEKELASKQGYFRGSLVQGTQGGGFYQGGTVGKNTMYHYGGFPGGMREGFADGGEVEDNNTPDVDQEALQKMINPSGATLRAATDEDLQAPKIDQIMAKYALSPEQEEQAMQMGMLGMGGMKNVGKLGPALERLAPAVESGLSKLGSAGNKLVQEVADRYATSKGLQLEHNLPKMEVNPNRGMRIAEAYEQMEHQPNDPAVKKAYDSLINETLEQYQHLKDSGLKVDRIKPGMENPYKTSQDMFNDIKNNNHMWFYPTESGFGGEGQAMNHPLLKVTGEKASGKPMLANDVFRVVHDYFGHAKEGTGFGPKGEENAWLEHMKMYSPEAQKALTTETRGQNSWVNFGPHGIENQAKPGSTVYAEQKAGLLPDWAMEQPSPVESLPPEQKAAMQDALDRLQGNIQSYGAGIPPKPNYSISPEQIQQNLSRFGKR